ncbi:hypothetical protein ACFQX6_43410 [Streptosporangium lutulentum]
MRPGDGTALERVVHDLAPLRTREERAVHDLALTPRRTREGGRTC